MKKIHGLFAMVAMALILVGVLPQSTLAADTYEIDPVHSAVMFKVNHLGYGAVYGRFNDFSGTVVYEKGNPAAGSVNVTVKMESVDTGTDKRDQHLRSPDFFSVKQFPVMTFKSTSITQEGNVYKMTGDLSLHGVTKKVTANVKYNGEGTDPWGKYRAGAEAHFVIKRSDFGITFMPDIVMDEVEVIVAFEVVK